MTDLKDSFEDGDYTSGVAVWTVNNGTFEVQDSVAKIGTYALKSNPTSTIEPRIDTPRQVGNPDAYEFWMRTHVKTTAGQYAHLIHLRETSTLLLGAGQSGAYLKYHTGATSVSLYGSQFDVDTWYMFKLVYTDEASTFDAYVYDTDSQELGSATGVSINAAGTIDEIRWSCNGGSISNNQYLDNVTVGVEEAADEDNAVFFASNF